MLNRRYRLAVCCLLLSGICATAHAADPEPIMNVRGKLLLDEPMDKAPSTEWKVTQGKWTEKEGSWIANPAAGKSHGPTIRHALPASDCILEVEVKFPELKNLHVSFNDDKGHVSRVMCLPSGLLVRRDTYEHVKDEDLMTVPMKPAPGQWHKLLIETRGDEMVAHLDDIVSYGKHSEMAKKKIEIALGAGGSDIQFRNCKIWAVEPNPDWAKAREKIGTKK